jgi:hypothetical protein
MPLASMKGRYEGSQVALAMVWTPWRLVRMSCGAFGQQELGLWASWLVFQVAPVDPFPGRGNGGRRVTTRQGLIRVLDDRSHRTYII